MTRRRRSSQSKFFVNWLLWPLRRAYFAEARKLARKAGLYR